MPRKTREQKIIADLRRQLRLRQAVNEEVPQDKPTISVAKEVSLPKAAPVSIQPVATSGNYAFLGRDLTKLGILTAAAIILEVIASYLITSGALKPYGIS